MMSVTSIKEMLTEAGLRTTSGRIDLLTVLAENSHPLSVKQLKDKLSTPLNEVTVYRTVEKLREARLVRRANLEHDHSHYELVPGRSHHHHAVCRNCGYVEDIEVPHPANPTREALKKTKRFITLDDYALDFFGICTACK